MLGLGMCEGGRCCPVDVHVGIRDVGRGLTCIEM